MSSVLVLRLSEKAVCSVTLGGVEKMGARGAAALALGAGRCFFAGARFSWYSPSDSESTKVRLEAEDEAARRA